MITLIKHWRIDPNKLTVTNVHTYESVHLEPKTMAVLMLLIERKQQVVSREDFMQQVWGGTFTVEESLTGCISQLRKIFGDNPRSAEYIKTIHKKGYQLLIEPLAEKTDKPDNEPSRSVSKKSGIVSKLSFVFAAFLLSLLSVSVYESVQNRSVNTGQEMLFPSNQLSKEDTAFVESQFFSSNGVAPSFTMSNERFSETYEVVTSLIGKTNAADNRVEIEIRDSENNPVWGVQRDFGSDEQRIAAANDLLLALGRLQNTQQTPELALLPSHLQANYKQALYLLDKRGKENVQKAIQLLDNILEERADFVMALVQKAIASRFLGFYETDSEQRRKSILGYELLLRQAQSIAPEHPVVKGITVSFDHQAQNWLEIEQAMKGAVQYAPGCTICVRNLAQHYLNLGYYQQAAETIEANLDYFPLSVFMHSFLGIIYGKQGDIDKTRNQADIIDALGANKGFDAMSIRLQVSMMEGDLETYFQLADTMLETHPTFLKRLEVTKALLASNLERAREIIATSPALGFNMALSAGMLDEIIARVQKNVGSGQLRDLSFCHGWLLPDTDFSKSYSKYSLELKNSPEIKAVFEDLGLFRIWEQNQKWPDYCHMDKYRSHRPSFCASRVQS